MAYAENIVYGTVTLKASKLTPRKVQSTLKYKVGRTLAKFPTPTRDATDWELRVSGLITPTQSTTIDTFRNKLEAADDVTKHYYTDGLKTGSYIMDPGSLQFADDENDVGMIYRYSFSLIEYNQT